MGLEARVSSASSLRGFRPLRISTIVENDLTGLLLTEDAGGFLPGVPPGCLGIDDRHFRPQPTRFLELTGFPVNLEPRPLGNECGIRAGAA
jgi:hypothetical protein